MELRFILILFILVLSCRNVNNGNDSTNKQFKSYYKAKPFEKIEFLEEDIFESYYANKCRFYPSSIVKFGYSGIFLTRSIGYETMVNKIKNSSIDSFPLSQTTKYFIPNSEYQTQKNKSLYGFLDISNKLCDLESFNNPNFIIYILDNKRGSFFNLSNFENYYEETQDYLNKKGNHGYTSGAIINHKKKKILFWVVIW